MAQQSLQGKKVAFLVAAEGIERVELTGPWDAMEKSGATPVLLSAKTGEVQTYNHLDKADAFTVDHAVSDTKIDEYDALVIPGGVANGDQLRSDEGSVSFVRDFVQSGKPVAVICHGPWALVEADVLRGRTVTSWPSLKTDIRNSGGTWLDEEVVVDGNLITSRKPDDLPAFNDKLTEALGG